jgi:radical SAM superfamily enzyme YgiQ (UPF0313 family)
MKVLLVNPNRFRTPPAPPLGLEYLAARLIKGGHAVRLLDLCFSDDPSADVDRSVEEFRPDLAGITVRNIDSVRYIDNEFFLDGIREVVHRLKAKHGIRVIAGGAALAADPEGIVEYIGADYGVTGPADEVINDVLSAISQGTPGSRIIRGHYRTYSPVPRCSSGIDYQKYLEAGGITGFETHKGCSSSCIYCIEADTPVAFRKPEDVIREIAEFTEQGHRHFHLCDPEFNEDLDHSLAVCAALKQSGIQINWTAYMKPANFNQKLFRLMRETGVYLITLSVDSFKKCPLYWSDTEKIVFNARNSGIRVIVDFLTGFPYEDEDLLQWCLDFFRRLQPDRVNINTYIRMYKSLKITRIIAQDSSLAPFLIGNTGDTRMTAPVFFNRINNERLAELIAGDGIFMIEGTEKEVNYSREESGPDSAK